MDYARKIGKRKDSNVLFEKRIKMLATTSYDPLIKDIPQDEYIEDRRLKNWQKWLNDRDKIGRRIKSLTGRSRIDQIINSSDKVRSVIELKNIIEYVSSIGIKPIKEFQKIPINVPDHYDLCLPKIKTILPIKMDLNFQSNLTYVDVPELIEREKGLHGISLKKKTLWERNIYLNKHRQNEINDNIVTSLINNKPQTKELLIRGKTKEKSKKFYKIPVITITAPEEDEQQLFDSDLTIILKIQDREIIQNKSFDDQCNDKSPIEWNFIFRGMVNERSEKMITFENKGNTVIHYYWRDWSFRSKVQYFVENDSPFYFNKTDGIILQGNTVRLTIFYLPRNSNVYTESWRLFTNPKLCECPLIFRLWSCAEKMKENIFDNLNISNIDLYLNRRIRDSIIRDILETIITNVDYRKPPEPAYVSLFLENDIFHVKNPYYYYHHNLLLEFREIYCEAVDAPTITWNLSLNDLRDILLLITNPQRRQQMLLRFNNLCKESLKPSLTFNHVNDQKYIIVYNLLCSFVNRFEIETEFVINNCILINEDKSSKQDNLSLSKLSVKSFNEKRKKRKSKCNKSINEHTPKNTMNLLVKDIIRDQFYMEIFFIRIREFLVETIDQISAAIESYNRLDGIDTSF